MTKQNQLYKSIRASFGKEFTVDESLELSMYLFNKKEEWDKKPVTYSFHDILVEGLDSLLDQMNLLHNTLSVGFMIKMEDILSLSIQYAEQEKEGGNV